MASVSWTATSSGAWNNAANWSAAPQQGDDVTINTPGSLLTVTYSTGSLALDSLTTGANDTFDMTGGTLSTSQSFSLAGSLAISAGTLRLAGTQPGTFQESLTQSGGSLVLVDGAFAFGGTLTQTGGTITIDHGALVDDEAGSLAGTMNGPGAFMLSAGNSVTVFQSGFVLATGAADIASGTVFLQEALTYGHKFVVANAGTLDLNGNAGKLTGYAALDGDINGGSLTVSGGGHLNGMTLDNGAVLTVQNSINQTGNITLGGPTGTGTLAVTSGGTLRVTGNNSMFQGVSAGTLTNSGLVEKTAGISQFGTMVVYDTVVNASSGIIDAAVGTIDFRGPSGGQQSSIAGTLEGNGLIAFDGGSYGLSNVDLTVQRLLFAQSTNVTLATAETYAGNWEQTGGLLLIDTSLTLNGTADFANGELKGTATVTDNGLLTLGSTLGAMDLEGNLNFAFNGTVDQVDAINLGQISDSVDRVTLASSATWSLEGASSISGAFGTITNNGTFARLDGAQNAVVASTIINNGALMVDTGTLSLTGQGTLAGTVGGSAVLDISGQFALASGVALSVGELILDAPAQMNDVQASLSANLSYAHDFAIEGGTLALNGNTLTLANSGIATFDGGAVQGSGVVVDNGTATIIGVSLTQGGELTFNSVTEQAGNVTLTGGSTAPVLTIGAAGVYTLDNAENIGGANNAVVGTLTVQGTLLAAGPGTSTIAAAVVDTGTISISHGQMQFLGPLTGSGALTISAGAILDLDGSNSVTSSIGFGSGGGLLYLANPSDYGGTIGGFATGDAVELNGFAFSNNGTPTTFSVSGDKVTITEASGGPSITLTFNTSQTGTQLMLGVGPHGQLALIHM